MQLPALKDNWLLKMMLKILKSREQDNDGSTQWLSMISLCIDESSKVNPEPNPGGVEAYSHHRKQTLVVVCMSGSDFKEWCIGL